MLTRLLLSLITLTTLLAGPARAQRAGGAGPPATDPFGRRMVPARAVPGGRYQSHRVFSNDDKDRTHVRLMLEVRSTDGSVRQFQTWAPGVVKISYFAPGRAAKADSSVSVVQPPQPIEYETTCNRGCDGPPPAETITKYGPDVCRGVYVEPGRLTFSVNCQTVEIDKKTLAVTFSGKYSDQESLLGEAGPAFQRVSEASTASASAAPGGTAVRFRLAPGEKLYGTGSRALPLDRRGYRLELYNQAHYASQNGEQNLNITLPTVLSSRGYMLFFDHHTAGYLDLGKTEKDVLEYGGENLTSLSYFVITGRDQAEILDRYTALTGRQPLPPRWALGLIQSRFGYKSETEMQAVAARMRRENFPLDALVLDLFWFGGTKRQGDFQWEKQGFPNPVGMMRDLRRQGVKTILISEPYVMRTSRNDSLVRTSKLIGTDAAGGPFTVGSFWAGPASILDVFKPSARDWLWSNYRRLHDEGAAGWWSDLGEPENHPDAMRHVAGPTRAVHNAYGQAWASIFTEHYAQEYPEERLFNLARSGWAGLQRNSVFPWSGDINRSWSGYQAQVPVMLGMGQGGVGYMHSDAGGFCVGGIDSELYTRWLQMASLCPILRPHGEGVPPEPYFYPDPYKSSVRAAVQLRYRLLPYLYTLAWQNTTTGAPIVRAMDYEKSYELGVMSYELTGRSVLPSAAQPITHNSKLITPSNDQYLLGPNLLVAPVLHPSQRRRNVVLPAGNWIDFHSNQTYAGGQTVGVAAPLSHTPLLVRAGALLPMTAYRPSTDQYRPDTLQLRYYADPLTPNSSFTLYEDDGHSAQALAKNQFDLLALTGRYSAAQTTLELNAKGGSYPGQPARRLVQLLVPRVAFAPVAVLLDGQAVPTGAVAYDAARHELRVEFPLLTKNAVLTLRGLRLLTTPAPDAAPETLTLEAPDNRSFGPGGTTLRYTQHAAAAPAAAMTAALQIRDAQGRVVRTLPLPAGAGAHALAFDARDAQGRPLPPGVYAAEAAGQHQRLILQAE